MSRTGFQGNYPKFVFTVTNNQNEQIMRKIFTLCLLACVVMTSYAPAPEEEKNLARVRRVNGVEAYILCEPVRAYEVVVDAGTGLKAESLLTGGLVNKSISARVEQFVRNIMKQNAKVDGVVYSAGKRIVGIKFTDEDKKNAGIGRVSRVMGYPVFVMNEPLTSYEVITNKGGGIKWKSLVTGGIVNNSIEEDVQVMVKKMQNRAADAMLFDGGKDVSAITFGK